MSLLLALCMWAITGCGGDEDHYDGQAAQSFYPLFPHSARPQRLVAIAIDPLTADQRLLAASLAGIVNGREPGIFLVRERVAADRFWLDMYERDYGIPFEGTMSLPEALGHFAPEVRGAILFDPDERATVNVAANLGSLARAIIASPVDESALAESGIPVLEDLAGRFATKEEADRYNDEELLPRFRRDAVANLASDVWELRDYLMAHSIFTFRYFPTGLDRARFADLLQSLPMNIPVMGYFARNGIEEFFGNQLVSSCGKWWVPSDMAPNLSVHSGVAAPRPAPSVRPSIEPFLISNDVTYVTAAFSDGDNYSCALRDIFDRFQETNHGPFPVGWTLPSTAVELMPAVVDYYYSAAPRHDDFIPISGLSYAHVSLYADQEWFTAATQQYLDLSGNDAVWSLDPLGMLYPLATERTLFKGLSISGYLFEYFAGCSFYGFSDQGLPLLFTRTSYPTLPEDLDDIIEQGIAMKRPGRPQVIFLGVNLWQIHVSDLARGFAPYLNRPDVRIVPATALLTSLKAWYGSVGLASSH